MSRWVLSYYNPGEDKRKGLAYLSPRLLLLMLMQLQTVLRYHFTSHGSLDPQKNEIFRKMNEGLGVDFALAKSGSVAGDVVVKLQAFRYEGIDRCVVRKAKGRRRT